MENRLIQFWKTIATSNNIFSTIMKSDSIYECIIHTCLPTVDELHILIIHMYDCRQVNVDIYPFTYNIFMN